jgi:hypothetical protein
MAILSLQLPASIRQLIIKFNELIVSKSKTRKYKDRSPIHRPTRIIRGELKREKQKLAREIASDQREYEEK